MGQGGTVGQGNGEVLSVIGICAREKLIRELSLFERFLV